MSSVKNRIKSIVPRSVYAPIRDFLQHLDPSRYIGNKLICPFCKGHFKEFLPAGMDFPVLKEKNIVGGGRRNNARCPRCLSTERERMIYFYLKQEKPTTFTSKIKLLHIAPEKNLEKKLRASSNISYTSADLFAPNVDIKMDITDTKQADETYDLIICNHVLEHIIEDWVAMGELFRILKKGGFAILQVPISYTIDATFEDESVISEEDREKVFGQKDHVRIYGHDYIQRLEKAGFKVEEIPFAANMGDLAVKKYSLNAEEKLFICSKA